MNFQLVTLKTSDGILLRYPLNFLARNCVAIKAATEEDFRDGISPPFTSSQFNLFLELLETRDVLLKDEETLEALRVADYLGLQLKPSELHKMVNGLKIEKIDQFDEFLIASGHEELSVAAMIHLLTHLQEFSEFKGLTLLERFDRFLKAMTISKPLTGIEVFKLLLPLVPQRLMYYLIDFPLIDILAMEPNTIGMMSGIGRVIRRQFFKDAPPLEGEGPDAGPLDGIANMLAGALNPRPQPNGNE